MTDKTKEVLRLALEALVADPVAMIEDENGHMVFRRDQAIIAIKEALAEQPKEPPKFDPNDSFAREEAAVAKVREFMRNH